METTISQSLSEKAKAAAEAKRTQDNKDFQQTEFSKISDVVQDAIQELAEILQVKPSEIKEQGAEGIGLNRYANTFASSGTLYLVKCDGLEIGILFQFFHSEWHWQFYHAQSVFHTLADLGVSVDFEESMKTKKANEPKPVELTSEVIEAVISRLMEIIQNDVNRQQYEY
jgi:hypothetical protein